MCWFADTIISRIFQSPMTLQERALNAHRQWKGKIEIHSKTPVTTRDELSLAYTPGVAAVSTAIANDREKVWEFTSRGNMVAIVSDGSAVLGLGNIGPEAALPVMEGKAVLFKEFAGIDAIPLCLATQDPDEIIETVMRIAPSFGGINLEDISAPRCFAIERQLIERLDIPVLHDDQHGTAIVVLAGIINAGRIAEKKLHDLKIVINGAGAAGTAIAQLLRKVGVDNIVVVDSRGIISSTRTDLNDAKKELAKLTNPSRREGGIAEAIVDRDVFIGVSAPGVLSADMVRTMAHDPIIFALANPVPEISPDEARAAGARLIATGRSDLSNQINNALVFPGVFRGALDSKLSIINDEVKIAAANALAACIPQPTAEAFIPSVFDPTVVPAVARAVIQSGTHAFVTQ
jgi:malate dehydrogenase (oxaloacetate-decarboxylating)